MISIDISVDASVDISPDIAIEAPHKILVIRLFLSIALVTVLINQYIAGEGWFALFVSVSTAYVPYSKS